MGMLPYVKCFIILKHVIISDLLRLLNGWINEGLDGGMEIEWTNDRRTNKILQRNEATYEKCKNNERMDDERKMNERRTTSEQTNKRRMNDQRSNE